MRKHAPLDLLADYGDEQYFDAQSLIDSGMAWKLEGSIGRQCMAAIESGACMLGPAPVRDFYGNLVPAWWMVEEGSKGSPEYAGRDRPREPSMEVQSRLLRAVGITNDRG